MDKKEFKYHLDTLTIPVKLKQVRRGIPDPEEVVFKSKPQTKLCEDCCLLIVDRKIEYVAKRGEWIKKCRSCPNSKKPKQVKPQFNPDDWEIVK